MNPKDLLKNESAVTISLGFILMFAITMLVVSSLILSFFTLSQHTEKSAMRESFRVLGEGLAVKITSIDALVSITRSYGGTVNTLEYGFSMPESIAAKIYTVNITNSTHMVIMESDNGLKIVAPFNISTSFTERKLYSGAGDYRLEFDGENNSIHIEER